MRDVLNEIEKQKSHFGEHLQPPASEAQLLELKSKVRQELHADVPKSYVSFLRRTNGLDWNGTVFFASDTAGLRDNPRIKLEGLVEANTRLREVPENSQFLILGESGMEMYAWNLSTATFDIVDHVSGDLYQSFKTFNELFAASMEKRLLQI